MFGKGFALVKDDQTIKCRGCHINSFRLPKDVDGSVRWCPLQQHYWNVVVFATIVLEHHDRDHEIGPNRRKHDYGNRLCLQRTGTVIFVCFTELNSLAVLIIYLGFYGMFRSLLCLECVKGGANGY